MALRLATQRMFVGRSTRYVPVVESLLTKRHASAMPVPTASLPENVGHDVFVW